MEWHEKIIALTEVTERETELLSLTPFERITVVIREDGSVIFPDNVNTTGDIRTVMALSSPRVQACWIAQGGYRENEDGTLDYEPLMNMIGKVSYVSYYDSNLRQSRKTPVRTLAWQTAFNEAMDAGFKVKNHCGEGNCIRPSHLKTVRSVDSIYQMLEPVNDGVEGFIGPCLIYKGSKGTIVPVVARNGRKWAVHRWLYATSHGPAPAKRRGSVRPECGTPGCVSPFHLFAFGWEDAHVDRCKVAKYLSFTEDQDGEFVDSLNNVVNIVKRPSVDDIRMAMETGGEVPEGTGEILLARRHISCQ